MTEQTTSSPQEAKEIESENVIATRLFGWVEGKYTSLIILIVLVLLSLVLMGIEWDKSGRFYGFFGFTAFSVAVLSGWPLGSWLRRKSSYYDEEEDETVEENDS